jgi:hypothetical protein
VNDSSAHTLDRLGAAAGLAAAALLVALLMVFPAPPAADEPIATIAAKTADNSQALLAGAYVSSLAGGALLVFAAAVAARLRRRETVWWIVALVGMTAAVSLDFVACLMTVVFVRAVGHGVDGSALWIGYGGDDAGFLVGVPYAVFMLGAGMGIRVTGVLPRWLGLTALVSVPLFVVGAASVAGREVDGAPFVFPLMLAYLAISIWTAAVSVALWRSSLPDRAELVPTAVRVEGWLG